MGLCAAPQLARTTGNIDIHNLAIDYLDRPVFVSTCFGCLATISEQFSFVPLWKPSFLSKLIAEDCCHLNATDPGLLRSVMFTDDANADFNGDGVVNIVGAYDNAAGVGTILEIAQAMAALGQR